MSEVPLDVDSYDWNAGESALLDDPLGDHRLPGTGASEYRYVLPEVAGSETDYLAGFLRVLLGHP